MLRTPVEFIALIEIKRRCFAITEQTHITRSMPPPKFFVSAGQSAACSVAATRSRSHSPGEALFSMKSNWTLALCAAVTVIITGCGSPQPPAKWFVRRGPTYNHSMPSVDRVGVLVDAAIIYDRVGTNYINLEDSRAAITNMIREATADLRSKKYEVAFVESPFVGAFKTPGTTLPVAEKRKDQPVGRSAPFFVDEQMNSDPAYRDALLSISRCAIEAVGARGELPTDQFRADETIRPALKAIATKRNVRYLFVVQGTGTIVSGGKQMGQGIGTALLSTAVSLGNVTVIAHNTSMLNSYASLIDLDSAEVLWCNTLTFGNMNPAEPDHYRNRWPFHMLYWLPPQGQLEPRPLQ
jgi:hypothetical protein